MLICFSVYYQEVAFQVENVQAYSGYVIHVGTVVETIKRGDNLILYLNKVRQEFYFLFVTTFQ